MCIYYIGGYSVHRGISWWNQSRRCTVHGGYLEYIKEISWVYQGVFSTWGGGIPKMRREWPVHSSDHDSCGGILWFRRGERVHQGYSVHWDFKHKINSFNQWARPDESWNPPMHSWYLSNALNISWRTHGIPPMYWIHIIQGDYAEFKAMMHKSMNLQELYVKDLCEPSYRASKWVKGSDSLILMSSQVLATLPSVHFS